jgi:hypothetical protein
MNQATRRNRLVPWYVGLVLILAAVIYTGYEMVVTGCAAPMAAQIIVLVVIPVIYLVLMYLTFVSQD